MEAKVKYVSPVPSNNSSLLNYLLHNDENHNLVVVVKKNEDSKSKKPNQDAVYLKAIADLEKYASKVGDLGFRVMVIKEI